MGFIEVPGQLLAVSFGGRSACGVDGSVERLDLDPKGPIEVPGEDLTVLGSGGPGEHGQPQCFLPRSSAWPWAT